MPPGVIVQVELVRVAGQDLWIAVDRAEIDRSRSDADAPADDAHGAGVRLGDDAAAGLTVDDDRDA